MWFLIGYLAGVASIIVIWVILGRSVLKEYEKHYGER